VAHVTSTRRLFDNGAANIDELVDLLSPSKTMQASPSGTATYLTCAAFAMMAIDDYLLEPEDVKNGIKDVRKEFGIAAITAYDIEHEGAVSDRILEESETKEFLIADLTGGRPSVYYELGHDRSSHFHLFVKRGTKIHFDVTHCNSMSLRRVLCSLGTR
jgi:hypothetical protein